MGMTPAIFEDTIKELSEKYKNDPSKFDYYAVEAMTEALIANGYEVGVEIFKKYWDTNPDTHEP